MDKAATNMATVVKTDLKFLINSAGNQNLVADWLQVHRSRVSRWSITEAPDSGNEIKIISLTLILAKLYQIFLPNVAHDWLEGINAFLNNQKPIDLIRAGRISEVLQAIEQTEAGNYV